MTKLKLMEQKYYDFMNDIAKDDLLEGLLGYGMFADKIPPIFTSLPLYNFCKSTGYTWTSKKDFSSISYESIRNISVPRILSIPHPAAYVNLCKYLHDIWPYLQKHFFEKTKDQSFKVSRVHLRKMKDTKELFEMNYTNGFKDGYPETDISIGARYIVKADISNCFPSIYTHAISWALVGLTEAKANQTDRSKWYYKIDYYTRAMKDNETHGILIGPHSSNLISEIILCAVDNELTSKYKYTRHIDDYTCFASSNQEAEEFLLSLSTTLKTYGLALNHKKTEIISLPAPSDKSWKTVLNNIQLQDTISISELKRYLDTAIELSKSNENIAVLKYAIKVLSKKTFSDKVKDYYFKRIHHLIIIYPYLLPLIEENVIKPLDIENERIKSLSDDILEDGIKYRRYAAINYALYFALKFKFKLIETDFIGMSKKCEDCVFMVLSFLYDKINNPDNIEQYKEIALKLQADIIDMDKYWLFIYEVLTKDELLDHQYKALKNGRVTFIKTI
ncbi:hypothetical protein SDC9_43845 [bioreactor metagenome]|uniref:Reverse transcriptase domain-containing protein n=1 Tax=bioreactor metagenome TaxID=1076179 RepID=A0A644W5G6_9ZZZZ